jgi:hypothetical protein
LHPVVFRRAKEHALCNLEESNHLEIRDAVEHGHSPTTLEDLLAVVCVRELSLQLQQRRA